jgi:hypothetical protein
MSRLASASPETAQRPWAHPPLHEFRGWPCVSCWPGGRRGSLRGPYDCPGNRQTPTPGLSKMAKGLVAVAQPERPVGENGDLSPSGVGV